MNLLNNISKAISAANQDKIKWIVIEKITIDSDIKAIFEQNETEIQNICEDMKANGYNAGNPATVSQDNVLVEGHTRYIAAARAGLKKIAVVYKHFDSKQEMLEYAYKQQLHRRNLSEQDIFNAYKKLRELTDAEGKKAKTDVEIAEELHVSPRQIAKMKEVEKKASPEVLEAFSNGELSLNKAYNQMKEELKPDEEKVEVHEEVVKSEKTDQASKPKKSQSEKPAVEKLNLKFNPEDFVLLKTAAEDAKLSVSEYVMSLVMNSVKAVSVKRASVKESA